MLLLSQFLIHKYLFMKKVHHDQNPSRQATGLNLYMKPDVKSVRLILALQSDPIYPPAHKKKNTGEKGREPQSGFEKHIKKALSQIPKIQ